MKIHRARKQKIWVQIMVHIAVHHTTIKAIQMHRQIAIRRVNGVAIITMIIINGVHMAVEIIINRHMEVMEILINFFFLFCSPFYS